MYKRKYFKKNASQNAILEKANQWLTDDFDKKTKERVKYLIDNDFKELEDAFGSNLEFGTGGLRGVMDVGPNRMNEYTIKMVTQGLSNYLLSINKSTRYPQSSFTPL